jgi:TRAP-type mannitol/chloroaromatic compound transport system substrate-binding protein
MPGWITIEEATRSNTILFGAMFLLLIMACAGFLLYIRREQQKAKKAISRAVAVAVKNATAKSDAKGEERRVRMFEAWAMAEDALKKTREELAAVTKERDELRASLDSLEAAVAGCPAAGVRVKKGTFNAHAA